MLFKRSEQTMCGIIHEDDDEERFTLNISYVLNIYLNEKGFKRNQLEEN
jgi:hypothetical protein